MIDFDTSLFHGKFVFSLTLYIPPFHEPQDLSEKVFFIHTTHLGDSDGALHGFSMKNY